jgi:hypothetical protein
MAPKGWSANQGGQEQAEGEEESMWVGAWRWLLMKASAEGQGMQGPPSPQVYSICVAVTTPLENTTVLFRPIQDP